jgi:hypothetical protein
LPSGRRDRHGDGLFLAAPRQEDLAREAAARAAVAAVERARNAPGVSAEAAEIHARAAVRVMTLP